jgi:hypothetical protein
VVAALPGTFYLRGDAGSGWVLGWWDRRTVLVRPTMRQAIRVDDGDRTRVVTELAIADQTLAAVLPTEQGSTVRLYSIEPDRH